MKRPFSKKKLSGKALARLITALVFLGSVGLVVLTVLVFMRTLSSVASARKIDTTKAAKLAGIDGGLLDSLLKFNADRTSRKALDVSRLNNPFVPLPPAPTPTEPEPAPVVAPQAQPASPPTGAPPPNQPPK